jgi:hypothetical protein
MPSSWIPAEPPAPPESRGSGRVHLRYEDVSQDGHLVIEALPHAMSAVWRQLAQTRPVRFGDGVVPILSRVVVEGGEGPIAVGAAAEAEGLFHVAHTVDAEGSVERLILAMWANIMAPVGRTHGPPPPDAGQRVVAGRVFAEHVFTRPFAAPADRKVRSLDLGDGTPFVPDARYAFHPPETTLLLPEGATALDAEPVLDTAPTVFGLDHTDSNQHVNSLVYPRLFIEAGLRRLHALDDGRGGPRLCRAMEIAYRKPCFAGGRGHVAARAFAWEGRRGITAALNADGDAPGARPRCAARLVFDR